MGKAQKIAALNDAFRRQPRQKGKVVMTAAIDAMGYPFIHKCLETIKFPDAFTEDNDPHGERDFLTFEVDGHKVWFKIDCYDRHYQDYGSEDPTDEAKTLRVGTFMFPEDY